MNNVNEDDDLVLAYVHNKRKMVIDHLTKDNKCPVDRDDVKLLLTALKDMDSKVISVKRIKVEEKQNSNQEQAAGMLARLLALTSSSKPFRSDAPVERILPVLGSEVPEPVLVAGETDTISVAMSYETFVADAQQARDPATD